MLRAMLVTVRFEPSGREVRVLRGTTLLEAARSAGLPLASACGADGLCARCGVDILQGEAGLCAEGEDERQSKLRNRVDARQRLACRVILSSDARVRASYW
jgi:ferredoxin